MLLTKVVAVKLFHDTVCETLHHSAVTPACIELRIIHIARLIFISGSLLLGLAKLVTHFY